MARSSPSALVTSWLNCPATAADRMRNFFLIRFCWNFQGFAISVFQFRDNGQLVRLAWVGAQFTHNPFQP
jgi:hypothetical protein